MTTLVQGNYGVTVTANLYVKDSDPVEYVTLSGATVRFLMRKSDDKKFTVDAEAVVKQNAVVSFSMGPLPNVNPTNLPTALKELAEDATKKTKTVSLNGSLDLMSYKNIQPGFWFSDGKTIKFYRMPTMDELHTKHRHFWRHL